MSIMKIGDVNQCTNETQTSWWLVSGADRDNKCLVSWAFLTGKAFLYFQSLFNNTNNKIVG